GEPLLDRPEYARLTPSTDPVLTLGVVDGGDRVFAFRGFPGGGAEPHAPPSVGVHDLWAERAGVPGVPDHHRFGVAAPAGGGAFEEPDRERCVVALDPPGAATRVVDAFAWHLFPVRGGPLPEDAAGFVQPVVVPGTLGWLPHQWQCPGGSSGVGGDPPLGAVVE